MLAVLRSWVPPLGEQVFKPALLRVVKDLVAAGIVGLTPAALGHGARMLIASVPRGMWMLVSESVLAGVTPSEFMARLRLLSTFPVEGMLRHGVKSVLGLAVNVVLFYILWRLAYSAFERAYSRYVFSRMEEKVAVDPTRARKIFLESELVTGKTVAYHSHGGAALDRSEASAYADWLAGQIGLPAYYVQMSKTDQLVGRQGSRKWYWAKDLTCERREYAPPDRHLAVIVDVDQYMDMPEYLAGRTCPVLLYTFQPHVAARESKDYSFTFDRNSRVVYTVNGGGFYTHHVWAYSSDHLVATAYRCGLPWRTTAYLVDRKVTSSDREIIFLNPIATWTKCAPKFSATGIYSRDLQRLRVVDGDYIRLMTIHNGVTISTAQVGSYAVATLPAAKDKALENLAAQSKYPLTLAQVENYYENDRAGSTVLWGYHRVKRGFVPPVICPAENAVRRYQFKPSEYDPEAKPGMTAFMSPLLNEAWVPDVTKGNEAQAIQGRVVSVRPKELVKTPMLVRTMDEFAKYFIPVQGLARPVDFEEVYERQSKPTQRRILDQSMGSKAIREIKGFLKREPYQGVKDPRIIATINGVDKREYSRYTYSFERLLKQQRWYAFGLKPREIADRVVKVLKDAKTAANTDFSRFDGHGSNLMRDFERMLLLRYFNPEHHEQLCVLHQAQYKSKAKLAMGTKFMTEYMRTSGSPDTSIMNSIFNAYIAYLGLRMDGREPDEAWEGLGLYGGDDGLTPDIDVKKYVAAAQLVGQELTFEPVARGKRGIKFLARIYGPDVWFGNPSSICDLKRQLSKFHVTVQLPANVPSAMKLQEKARSYILSDANTPIIGEFCAAVKRCSGGELVFDERCRPMLPWNGEIEVENQYPNEPGEWMMDELSIVLPEVDYKGFCSWASSAQHLPALLLPSLLKEPTPAKSSVPVVVDGTRVGDGKDASSDPLLERKAEVKDVKEGEPSPPPPAVAPQPSAPVRMIKHRDGKEEPFEVWKQRRIAQGRWSENNPRLTGQRVRHVSARSAKRVANNQRSL